MLARFAPHLLSLLFPLNALTFVLTGPHPWWASLLFIALIVSAALADATGGTTTRPPVAPDAKWPFDVLLVVLTGLQFTNVFLLARMMRASSVLSFETIAAMIVVGSASAHSGIVIAHELIHRPQKLWQTLGRLILATVLYEHFFTEHIRGHHLRVGTREDPATARFGESFTRFYLRTLPGQFRSAWQLECARLGDPNLRWYDPRMLRNRVVHGIVVELGIAGALGVAFGPAALLAHVLQAFWATRALEVVNYFEHWGIQRQNRRVLPAHSWDTHSRFTYYALTGLSRHADHHAFASRPYHQLRVWEESPKLPTGYLAMFYLVLARNQHFQKLMTAELRSRKLGPFAPAEPNEAPSA
jgi:alkane 1-monooxygenase